MRDTAHKEPEKGNLAKADQTKPRMNRLIQSDKKSGRGPDSRWSGHLFPPSRRGVLGGEGPTPSSSLRAFLAGLQTSKLSLSLLSTNARA